jgi:hypothetical protein
MTLRAGAAQVVITPPVGTFLEGYGARTSGSVGVHDDLHARAIVTDDGHTTAAIVACDLIGIDRRLAAEVRHLVEATTGIPGAHVMVTATHTHAGPVGLRNDQDGTLFDVTAPLIAGAVAEAHASMRPALLKAGAGCVETVSQNRRHPDGPTDDRLQVILFDDVEPHGPPIGGIVNFACHSTVLYHTNMHISADYAGHAVRSAQQLVGAPMLFLNGACGDVNPSWIEQRHAEAYRVGSIVGAEAGRRMQELRPHGHEHRTWNIRWDELTERSTPGRLIDPEIRVASAFPETRLRRLDPPDTYAARLRDLRGRLKEATDVEARHRIMETLTMLQGEQGVAARLRPDGSGIVRPEVQAIRFGPGCTVLGLPGEFFAETGIRIRESAGQPDLAISCYTNHHVMYVVPRRAFSEGGYEPGVAVLDEDAEEVFVASSLDVLRQVDG